MNDETWDRILRVMAHPYRRQLLVALLDHNPQDADNVDPLDTMSYTPDEAETLRVELIHNHLPKLEQQGYVVWDREIGTLSKGPNWDEIGPLLQLIHNHRDELPDGFL